MPTASGIADIYTSFENPRIEVQPYAYVYKDGTTAELKYFEKEKRTLTLKQDYGTQRDFDEFYKIAKILNPTLTL